MSDTPALAVFVKTPGVSPVKTRLAASIGKTKAEEFFRLSIAAVEATMTALAADDCVRPYWAISEKEALTRTIWQRHPKLQQGLGELGRRIERVFNTLFKQHKIVLAIGADSPQITPPLVSEAIDYLRINSGPGHVLGRCHDGGFYLVGINHRLPAGIWDNISYSTGATADELASRLAQYGPIHELSHLSDVDRARDLFTLRSEMRKNDHLSGAQRELLRWIENMIESQPCID